MAATTCARAPCSSCQKTHCDFTHSWNVAEHKTLVQIISYRHDSEDNLEEVESATACAFNENEGKTEESGLAELEFSSGIQLVAPSDADTENLIHVHAPDDQNKKVTPCILTCTSAPGCAYGISAVDTIGQCRTAEFYDQSGQYLTTSHGTFLHSQEGISVYMLQFSPDRLLKAFTVKMVSLGGRQNLWVHSIHITLTAARVPLMATSFSMDSVEAMCRSMGTDVSKVPGSTKYLLAAMEKSVNKGNQRSEINARISGDSRFDMSSLMQMLSAPKAVNASSSGDGGFDRSSLMQMFSAVTQQPNVHVLNAQTDHEAGSLLPQMFSSYKKSQTDADRYETAAMTSQQNVTNDGSGDISRQGEKTSLRGTCTVAGDEYTRSDIVCDKSSAHLHTQRFETSREDLRQMVDECVVKHMQAVEKSLKEHVSREIAEMEQRLVSRLDQIAGLRRPQTTSVLSAEEGNAT